MKAPVLGGKLAQRARPRDAEGRSVWRFELQR